jgi:hypothetical protein
VVVLAHVFLAFGHSPWSYASIGGDGIKSPNEDIYFLKKNIIFTPRYGCVIGRKDASMLVDNIDWD